MCRCGDAHLGVRAGVDHQSEPALPDALLLRYDLRGPEQISHDRFVRLLKVVGGGDVNVWDQEDVDRASSGQCPRMR